MLLCSNELFVVLAGIRSLSLNVRYRGQPEKHLLTSGHSISKPLQAASGRLARRQAFQVRRMTTWISSIRLNNEMSRYKRTSGTPSEVFFCSAGPARITRLVWKFIAVALVSAGNEEVVGEV